MLATKRYTLADIAKMILGNDADTQIIVHNDKREHNYCGDNSLLKSMNIKLVGLIHSLKIILTTMKEDSA